MYVLATNGYDTRHGHFARYGYNICAFVQIDQRPLPTLRHDFGDLQTLANDGWFPVPLEERAANREAFRGELQALNWPWTQIFPPRKYSLAGRAMRKLIPASARPHLAQFLARGAGALTADHADSSDNINPSVLTE